VSEIEIIILHAGVRRLHLASSLAPPDPDTLSQKRGVAIKNSQQTSSKNGVGEYKKHAFLIELVDDFT
jgi:hypothetical protein